MICKRFKALKDIVIVDTKEFDFIIGMSSLFFYHATHNYYVKTIMVEMPKIDKLEWEGTFKRNPIIVMLVICA